METALDSFFYRSLGFRPICQFFLRLIGVIVDPTTAGLGDSERAMGYAEPWDDELNN